MSEIDGFERLVDRMDLFNKFVCNNPAKARELDYSMNDVLDYMFGIYRKDPFNV